MTEFEKFMKTQCDGCAYELIDNPEHCTACGGGLRECWIAALEAAAVRAEKDKNTITIDKRSAERIATAIRGMKG
jgi:hypothetical protein